MAKTLRTTIVLDFVVETDELDHDQFHDSLRAALEQPEISELIDGLAEDVGEIRLETVRDITNIEELTD